MSLVNKRNNVEEADGFLFIRKRPKHLDRTDESSGERRSSRRKTATLRAQRPSAMNGLRSHPHENVGIENMYRHISQHLADPVRLKQLWIWIIHRELEQGDLGTEQLTAREQALAKKTLQNLQFQLLESKINLSWFTRDPSQIVIDDKNATSKTTLPNPANTNNLKRLQRYTDELGKWTKEEEQWNELLEQSSRTEQQELEQPSVAGELPSLLTAEYWKNNLESLNLEYNQLQVLLNSARANVQSQATSTEQLLERISVRLRSIRGLKSRTDPHKILFELSNCVISRKY